MTNLEISRLLIVGACARAAAHSAQQAGYEVLVADLFGDMDTRKAAICETLTDYPNDIPEIVKRLSPDAVCITGALENYPSVLEEISNYSHLLAPPTGAIKVIRCPEQFGRILRTSGFAFPEIVTARSPAHGRWLVKPFRSAGGQKIRHVQKGAVCPANHYLQQYIDGCPMSASYLLQQDNTILLGTSQLLQSSDQSNFHFQGAITKKLAPQLEMELIRLGDLLRKQHLRGLIGVDFILQEDRQLVILEVNPRYTATMELYEEQWGQPLVGCHIDTFRGIKCPLVSYNPQQLSGKQIVYTDQTVTVSNKLLIELTELVDAKTFQLSDIPHPGTVIESEQPLLTIQGKGKTAKELKQDLDSITKRVLGALQH